MPSPRLAERPLRLAALYSHPIQYFAPLMRTLATRTEVELTVYYCSRQGLDVTLDPQFGVPVQWDTPLLDGYRSCFLANIGGERGVQGFFRLINPAIVTELVRGDYDAILIHGYEHATKWLAFVTAWLTGTRVILRGESQLLNPRSLLVRVTKRLLLQQLFRSTAICAYIGEQNRAFYRKYGVSDDRLVFAPYVVDNAYFQAQAERLLPQRTELRARLGIADDRPIILASGKLIPKKQPLLLLSAYKRVRSTYPCALVFMGDGELRSQIEQLVQAESVPDVVITGFVNQGHVAEVYSAADLLALPSENEPWGLVVNEAMNFGLPIIASNRVGSVSNLVRPGYNGFVVTHDSEDELTAALQAMVMDGIRRQQYGRKSRDLIDDYSLEFTANALIRAATDAATGSGQLQNTIPASMKSRAKGTEQCE